MPYPPVPEFLASTATEDDEHIEFYWVGDETGTRGAKVITVDQHGMRWTLDANSTHLVTQRVAAGLLNVSLMTVNKWVREGRLGERQYRNGVSVIPMEIIEQVAIQRGVLPYEAAR
jgi:hypothetical protein